MILYWILNDIKEFVLFVGYDNGIAAVLFWGCFVLGFFFVIPYFVVTHNKISMDENIYCLQFASVKYQTWGSGWGWS